jgi:hypothetical protein
MQTILKVKGRESGRDVGQRITKSQLDKNKKFKCQNCDCNL